MFKVKEGVGRTLWVAGDGSSTYYIGQLVSLVAAGKAHTPGTVVPLAVPAGAADATNFQIPFGVVVGFNKRTTTRNSTYGLYDGGVLTQALQLARDWVLNEGMYSKGDPQVLLKVAEILPSTVLEGPIYNAAYGTAPTVVADTAGTDTTGYTTAGTTGACDFTPVANLATIYCRSGANKGLYRTTNDTTNTAPDVTVAFPYDVVLGDTFVRVPLKQGFSHMYIGGPGMYIDCSQLDATNAFHTVVYKLDLREASKETATFRFCADHFSFARA